MTARFTPTLSPFKRALRNAIIMSFVIGGVLHFQGAPLTEILLTVLFSFAIILPALFFSYRFTENLLKKTQTIKENPMDMNATGIQVGQAAPNFSQPNQHQKMVTLNDFAGKNLVLYFYPKDDTPGCTIEANDFTALAAEFNEANTAVVGVSKDSCSSHLDFIEKFDLGIDLLADTEGTLCEAYDVWREKEKNGVKKMGIVRSTFVINAMGTVVYAEYGVDPSDHAQAMLNFVKGL
ncbi:peroxiredoxin [Thiosulfativibrio zosterae]|uniref:thioredoxin-dependent peroxiredoxin n=1 Tax=Thiosulfativibrio zosterae TaxID=2675053 RepID=A0A6F8PMZ9_9GAMM|nr:peroxiredoxin [Thiosulfativibrio zosterae]BBP43370.1 hypothetical protein THMIRHAT_11160 [Thiosulfativibrio zosterae]